MTNGVMDRAQLEALKSADPEEQMAYLLTCASETKRAVDGIPAMIATAIAAQRAKDRRMVIGISSAVATFIGLAIPLVIHFT